jgi:hypothetical protein
MLTFVSSIPEILQFSDSFSLTLKARSSDEMLNWIKSFDMFSKVKVNNMIISNNSNNSLNYEDNDDNACKSDNFKKPASIKASSQYKLYSNDNDVIADIEENISCLQYEISTKNVEMTNNLISFEEMIKNRFRILFKYKLTK